MLNPPQSNSQTIPTLIVSRPGIMQQSLRAALAAYPWIVVVASAGDGLTALNYAAKHQPRLLVIDSNLLEEEVEALLAALKSRLPDTRCLVFSPSSQGIARLLAYGADAVIRRDSPAHELQAALLRLVPKPPE